MIWQKLQIGILKLKVKHYTEYVAPVFCSGAFLYFQGVKNDVHTGLFNSESLHVMDIIPLFMLGSFIVGDSQV